jgi:hypothetical protein
MIAWYYLPIALWCGVCLGLLAGGLARSASMSEAAVKRMRARYERGVGDAAIGYHSSPRSSI